MTANKNCKYNNKTTIRPTDSDRNLKT